jgi:hypothetical protein
MVLVISIKNIFLSFCIFKKKNCCVRLLIYLYSTYKGNPIYLEVGIRICYQDKNMVRWFTFGILKSSHLTLTIVFAFKIISNYKSYNYPLWFWSQILIKTPYKYP